MIICIALVFLNFILYFLFGSFVTARISNSDEGMSLPLTIVVGFFLYYSIFTLFCVPVMYRWRPLSMLSNIWAIAVAIIAVVSIILNYKSWKRLKLYFDKKLVLTACIVLTIIEAIIIIYAYHFTLDAAYYVTNAGTSVETNMMNVYDPYTGDWQDHFQMRYFFATYPIQDSVMCYLFGIHPLMQTKIVMAAVVIILTNLIYVMVGKELFANNANKTFLFLLFATLINFFFITIYTSSNFMITRTYEGKNVLANVIIPMIFYMYIRYLKGKVELFFVVLFIICFGAPVVSNSANMIVPAALFIFMVPLFIKERKLGILVKTFVCMLPCLVLLLTYIAYVKGVFVFYTYPR